MPPPQESPTASRPLGLRDAAWLGPAVLLAAGLRLAGLSRQVLGGDELHAVRIAAIEPLGRILTQFSRTSDHSIPLTALYRLYGDLVGPLGEGVLRAPIVVSGVLLVLLLPLLAARWFGRPTAAILAWWLATSPLLVLYSRIVRSYGPMVLLAVLAVALFAEWSRTGRRRDAVGGALCGALAVWFHLLAAPFVVAPLLEAAARRALRRDAREPVAGVLLPAGLLALFLAACLLPCGPTLVEFVRSKSSGGALEPATLAAVARHHAGVSATWPAVVFFGLAAVGAARAVALQPRVATALLSALALQLLAVAVSRPDLVQQVLVLSRYLLAGLPFVGLFAACALGGLPRGPREVLGAAFVVGLFLLGPLSSPAFRRSSFVHHTRFLEFSGGRTVEEPRGVPALYDDLAREGGAVVEYPTEFAWRLAVGPAAWQERHGQDVLVASDWSLYADPRLALAHSLHGSLEAILASGARWLVVHTDPSLEPHLEGERARRAREAGEAMAERCRRALGPPAFASDGALAFDLDRAR